MNKIRFVPQEGERRRVTVGNRKCVFKFLTS